MPKALTATSCLLTDCLPAAKHAGIKEGGQALLGGLDVTVHRNFFGAQINSFETQLLSPACFSAAEEGAGNNAQDTFRAVFIRAPAVLEAGPGAHSGFVYVLLPAS